MHPPYKLPLGETDLPTLAPFPGENGAKVGNSVVVTRLGDRGQGGELVVVQFDLRSGDVVFEVGDG